ncbi:MAG TPA: hypothetical protein VND54_10335 [Candidatus Saccharimonadales bacterium]|nr:hypothetical protein [Candidatus Saccharimonadales bacterium]HVC42361.1 hypothetical protein [Candidatus Saccharimonadales bacterium]
MNDSAAQALSVYIINVTPSTAFTLPQRIFVGLVRVDHPVQDAGIAVLVIVGIRALTGKESVGHGPKTTPAARFRTSLARPLLGAVSRGDLAAAPVTIRDLEASACTLEAVAEVLKPDDP